MESSWTCWQFKILLAFVCQMALQVKMWEILARSISQQGEIFLKLWKLWKLVILHVFFFILWTHFAPILKEFLKFIRLFSITPTKRTKQRLFSHFIKRILVYLLISFLSPIKSSFLMRYENFRSLFNDFQVKKKKRKNLFSSLASNVAWKEFL